MKRFIIIIGLMTLSGCQTSDSPYTRDLAKAEKLIEDNKYEEAYPIISHYMPDGGDSGNLVEKTFDDSAGFKKALPSLISNEINKSSDIDQFYSTKKLITELGRRNIIGADKIEELDKSLNARVAADVMSGKLVVDYSDEDAINAIGAFSQPEVSHKVFQQSLSVMKADSDFSNLLLKGVVRVANQAGNESTEMAEFKEALPYIKLNSYQLKETIGGINPVLASQITSDRKIAVELHVVPEDRLLEEDIKLQLKESIPFIAFTADDPSAAVITLKKLQWEERPKTDSVQTVTYSRNEVNILSAAMLMPQYSSYQYDVRSGGAELAYAFEITAIKNGYPKADELVREKVSKEWRSCSNARIQNAFGGTQPANFVANDQMQQVCNGSQTGNIDEMKTEALATVARRISKLPILIAGVN